MFEQRWIHLNKPAFGLINQVSELVQSLDEKDGNRLPDLRRGTRIIIGSDFSGEQSASEYEVMGLLFADIENAGRWAKSRLAVRSLLPNDGRRFAFKNLSEGSLSRALPSFVAAADQIPGLLVTILTHKSIPSLFKLTGRIQSSDEAISAFPGWKPRVMERLLRVVHFISLFLAGLSRPLHDVLWVTDEDAIVANVAKHRELVTMFGRVCSHYLPHTLREVRIATTASDTGKRDVEDFVAIPDLACGALAEVLTAYRRSNTLLGAELIAQVPSGLAPKTIDIMNWLAGDGGDLKKITFAIDPVPNSTALTVRLLHFHGSQRIMRS